MIGLIQRVSEASVMVDGRIVGLITRGLLVLVGVEKMTTKQARNVCPNASLPTVFLQVRRAR